VDRASKPCENAAEVADAIEEFLTGSKASVAADRVLATVLFTDIVGSTEKAATLGDGRWRDLLDKHNSTIRRNIVRFRGRETNTTGDGFLITFDGPGRAVRCACAIVEEIRPLGIDVRAGLHTGECEEIDDNIGVSRSISALASSRWQGRARFWFRAP
jgi:class 3 adenylate cyclase